MTTNIQTLIKDINEAKAAFKEKGKEALKQSFKEFFDANPEVTSIGWTQYAPYFNDGEPCEFAVHDFVFSKAPLDHDDWDMGSVCNEDSDFIRYDNEFVAESKSISDFNNKVLAKIPDEIYRDLFGDDSMVVVTRDGISTEYYEHD
jgi:hypothetical protein